MLLYIVIIFMFDCRERFFPDKWIWEIYFLVYYTQFCFSPNGMFVAIGSMQIDEFRRLRFGMFIATIPTRPWYLYKVYTGIVIGVYHACEEYRSTNGGGISDHHHHHRICLPAL